MPKTALITGASRGIGHSIAAALYREGYSLIVTCKQSYDRLEQLRDELLSLNRTDQTITLRLCDCSNPGMVEELFGEIPSVDVLVNNAGISMTGLLHEMSVDDWNTMISTNLSGVFYHCKYCIPLMLRKHAGHIINISSVWGAAGASMEVAYSASKGGVNTLTRALARELAPSHIQVNAIACGLIDTDMNRHLTTEETDSLIEQIPADRIGTPEDIARAVLMLLHAPSYLTGQIITVDGAWT